MNIYIKYILIIVLIILAVFFFWMFKQRSATLPIVQKNVTEFFMAVQSEDDYEQYLHDAFKDIFNESLLKKFPENFTNIVSVDNSKAGVYKTSTDTGTTFEYDTVVNYSYNGGQKVNVTIKLKKEDDKWLIYGINFTGIKI